MLRRGEAFRSVSWTSPTVGGESAVVLGASIPSRRNRPLPIWRFRATWESDHRASWLSLSALPQSSQSGPKSV